MCDASGPKSSPRARGAMVLYCANDGAAHTAGRVLQSCYRGCAAGLSGVRALWPSERCSFPGGWFSRSPTAVVACCFKALRGTRFAAGTGAGGGVLDMGCAVDATWTTTGAGGGDGGREDESTLGPSHDADDVSVTSFIQ